jgi:hypothetical protein
MFRKSTLPPTALASWSASVVQEASNAHNLTVGIVSGHRNPTDRRVLDQLARSFALSGTTPGGPQSQLLVIRLRYDLGNAGDREASDGEIELSRPLKSPLGSWSVVDVVPPRTRKGLDELPNRIAHALPDWKRAYKIIVIDLGSVGSHLSRQLGYLCDAAYIVLGPEGCGAPDWLRLQIANHEQSGSHIVGTLTVAYAPAA